MTNVRGSERGGEDISQARRERMSETSREIVRVRPDECRGSTWSRLEQENAESRRGGARRTIFDISTALASSHSLSSHFHNYGTSGTVGRVAGGWERAERKLTRLVSPFSVHEHRQAARRDGERRAQVAQLEPSPATWCRRSGRCRRAPRARWTGRRRQSSLLGRRAGSERRPARWIRRHRRRQDHRQQSPGRCEGSGCYCQSRLCSSPRTTHGTAEHSSNCWLTRFGFAGIIRWNRWTASKRFSGLQRSRKVDRSRDDPIRQGCACYRGLQAVQRPHHRPKWVAFFFPLIQSFSRTSSITTSYDEVDRFSRTDQEVSSRTGRIRSGTRTGLVVARTE